MGRRLFFWEAAGFLWTAAAGTLRHFAWDWSGGGAFAAAFSAVNESTWEHMKLLFVPLFLFTVVQVVVLGRTYPNLLAVRAVTVLLGLSLIPVLFYTYQGVLGFQITRANIAVFYLSALAAFVLDFRLLRQGRLASPWQQLAGLAVLWVLAFAFVWCTFRPPRLGLWRDPLTGGYGPSI